MRASQFTEEQIIGMLKEQEAGAKTPDVCRKRGISSATFHKFKARYGGMEVSDARQLRALEDENARLKKLLAEQMLDNAILKDVASKVGERLGVWLAREAIERKKPSFGDGFLLGSDMGIDIPFVLCRPGSDLLSRVLRRSTIGAEEFNGRVRDGIGFRLLAIATRPAKDKGNEAGFGRRFSIGHGPGWTSRMRTIKPIERLVPVSSTCRHAYTPGLSTWWSSTALKGILVLRWVSRLDAFSGYPDRT